MGVVTRPLVLTMRLLPLVAFERNYLSHLIDILLLFSDGMHARLGVGVSCGGAILDG